jgi:hypothetical protein
MRIDIPVHVIGQDRVGDAPDRGPRRHFGVVADLNAEIADAPVEDLAVERRGLPELDREVAIVERDIVCLAPDRQGACVQPVVDPEYDRSGFLHRVIGGVVEPPLVRDRRGDVGLRAGRDERDAGGRYGSCNEAMNSPDGHGSSRLIRRDHSATRWV